MNTPDYLVFFAIKLAHYREEYGEGNWWSWDALENPPMTCQLFLIKDDADFMGSGSPIAATSASDHFPIACKLWSASAIISL